MININLVDFLQYTSVSGTESFSDFGEFLQKNIKSLGGKFITNSNGDIIASFGDFNSNEAYVLEAHLDEVGFFINQIEGKTIYLGCIGSYNFQYLDGIEGVEVISVTGKKYTGIINYIGNGYFKLTTSDYKKCRVGDILTFKRKVISGNEYIIAPSLDNKVGCALLLNIAKRCSTLFKEKKKQLVLVFSAGEEIVQNSSAEFLKSLKLDIKKLIVVDAAYANPVVTNGLHLTIPDLGQGPAIQHIGENFIISRKNIDFVKKLSKENGIPLQDEIATLQYGRTNYKFFYRYGFDTFIINIPVAYQHTMKSKMSIKDYINGIKLVVRLFEKYIEN